MQKTVVELESAIRDRINEGRKQYELLARAADWNRLCSALDVIGDTELALDSYLKHAVVRNIGTKYLHIYGALQLLQTQQDAAAELCSALQIKPQASPKIPLIRQLRSSAIGHPTHQREDSHEKSNFIVRVTVTQFSFTLFTVTTDEESHTEHDVNIPKLIELQSTAIGATLSEVIKLLDEAEVKHREEHKNERLADCFPKTLSYYESKIFEAIHSTKSHPLGKMHIDLIGECLERFQSMLELRGEWGVHESINYEFGLIEYPIKQLSIYFSKKSESKLNEKDAYIFCAFIGAQLKSLIKLAEEIDLQYSERLGG
ncbi:hypothetical protein BH11PSE7_BH11PSE7_31400 [soil metagenome]